MELEVLGDRYELQEPIGRGGMATIYRAVDLRMGRTVAVKILREVYSTDPKFVTRFQREARAASALQHPNIVQVFDYGQSGESYYIVMEFVEGMDLRRYLKKRGMLENERAIEIAHDVALGLGAAHKRGIVHRDVKPQNVMLNDDGLVKLTDFGIASMYKDAEAERLTTTGMTLGTVQYYAPEQAQGEIVSPAADIYALGIVMYEMLAGRTPFDGDTPVAVAMRHIQDEPEPPSLYNPRIAPGLERIILRCLAKDPRDRYRDGDALAYALENYNRNSGGRRGATGVTPSSRPQFAPIGLPMGEGRGGGTGLGAYGAPAVTSGGPRVTRVPSKPYDAPGLGGGMGTYGGLGDAPTYEGYDSGPGGVNTRPWGPAPGTLPRSPSTGRPSGPYGVPQGPDDENNKRRISGPIIGVIIGAAVLLLGLSCFLVLALTNNLPGSGGGNASSTATVQLVSVPNFVGMKYTDAQALASSSHLQLNEQMQASDSVPKDTVISQAPTSGQSVPPNSYVTLTVSSGKGMATVPDVVGKTYLDAQSALTQLGFQVVPVYQPDAITPASHVIKTNPAAGQSEPAGSQVIVYVSSGQPTATPAPSPSPSPTVTPTPTPTAAPTSTP